MVVYKVTNLINNKIYIGKTVQTINKRRKKHLSDIKIKRYDSALHAAIRKYGEENFVWEVLDKVMFSDLLFDLEKFYIKKYNSKTPNGYNLTDGGEGILGCKRSPETKAKLSIAGMGRHPSPESRKKMSIASTGRRHSLEVCRKIGLAKLGKKLSPEHIAKLSAAHKGNKPTTETRAKLSVALMGHSVTTETRAKISNTKKEVFAKKRIETIQ